MSDFAEWAVRLSDDYIQDLEHRDWGPLAFTEIRRPLEIVRAQLASADTQAEFIPASMAAEAIAKLGQLETVLTAIRDYDPKGTPGAQHDSLIQQVVALKDGVVQALRPFVRDAEAEASVNVRELRGLVDELRTSSSRADEARRALEPVLGRAQQMNLDVAGDDAASFFDGEGALRGQTARNFLVATSLAIAALTVAAGVFIYWYQVAPPMYANVGDALAGVVPKVTLLLVLSFVVGFCARNYRVNSHLAVLNRTKALTLRSAKNYAASVDEPTHRDLVVASLVQSVFSLGDTGYLPIDSERTIIETPGAGAILNSARGSLTQ